MKKRETMKKLIEAQTIFAEVQEKSLFCKSKKFRNYLSDTIRQNYYTIDLAEKMHSEDFRKKYIAYE